jgi:hypothetical protein
VPEITCKIVRTPTVAKPEQEETGAWTPWRGQWLQSLSPLRSFDRMSARRSRFTSSRPCPPPCRSVTQKQPPAKVSLPISLPSTGPAQRGSEDRHRCPGADGLPSSLSMGSFDLRPGRQESRRALELKACQRPSGRAGRIDTTPPPLVTQFSPAAMPTVAQLSPRQGPADKRPVAIC